MKYLLILVVILVAGCVETKCEESPKYIDGERHILITTQDGVEWVKH